jgi:predicted nucleic acid-binding protein
VIVLDTTILVYAVGGDHPLAEPSRRIIEAVRAGRLRATTTVEAVQEFVNVRARRRPRSNAAKLGRDYATLLSPLLVVEEEDLERGLHLFERHQPLGSFDAVLAAAAMRRNAEALVSADRAFAVVQNLRHVDPGEPALDELLRG